MSEENSMRREFIKRIAAGTAMALPGVAYDEGVASAARKPSVNPSPFFNVAAFGASGDGKAICTGPIQKAIDECGRSGGGRVVFPAGRYLTGPIFLKSNVHVEVMPGAVLVGITDFDRVPSIRGRFEGIDRTTYAAMFTGQDLENISITGRGALDGQGEAWWRAFRAVTELRKRSGILEREPENPPGSPLKWPRPRMINLYRCRNVLISGITILNSPSWNIHPVLCDNVCIDGVTIQAPPDSPNTDGIDPDSSRNIRISNCYISVGDDCITIKSGYKHQDSHVPSENIAVTNCVFGRGHGGVGIGSETAGGVRNVTISNCVCEGTDRGLRFKTGRGRGNVVENIRAQNVVMRDVGDALSLSMLYAGGDTHTPAPVNEGTPTVRNIHLSDIVAAGVKRAAVLEGLPEMPMRDLSISNFVAQAEEGISCFNVSGMIFDNVSVDADNGPVLAVAGAQGLEVLRLSGKKPRKGQTIIRLEKTADCLIQSCAAAEGTETFLELRGTGNRDISLIVNRLSRASRQISFVEGALDSAIVKRL